MKGKAVRDAQARLSVDALVAEAFESPALGDDDTKVELLYAERRGTPTRRVVLGKNIQGGRCYKPIVLKVGDAENGHGEDMSNADDTSPGRGHDITNADNISLGHGDDTRNTDDTSPGHPIRGLGVTSVYLLVGFAPNASVYVACAVPFVR
jgi:hypothetical protein